MFTTWGSTVRMECCGATKQIRTKRSRRKNDIGLSGKQTVINNLFSVDILFDAHSNKQNPLAVDYLFKIEIL